ncbi:hypothetical protein QR680_017600 [Steinernema hermaphroditum]|uniref:EGF-like domain-containing protein n=1 Tax=Steinernema hermaphroditum TaxID=289476 RepID=A0AA39HH73_9BILA|nr:hypothetical protein QR680_017600 [Steinernema hermaphroditum]
MLLRAILLGIAFFAFSGGSSASVSPLHYKIQAHFDVVEGPNLRDVTEDEHQVQSVLRRRLHDPLLTVRIVDQQIHGEAAQLPTSWVEAIVSPSRSFSREDFIERFGDESTEVVLYYLERLENYTPPQGSSPRAAFAQLLTPHACFNGGVMLPNGTCVCKPYFEGADCAVTVCTHSGVVSDKNRCSCPPGFIGRHCESMPCLPPVQTSFDFSKRSLIYVLSLRDSMGRDIQQLYAATSKLLQEHPEDKFSSFILVTYLAKGSTYAINSYTFTTLSDFLNGIANAVISPGSALQPTVAALREALSKDPLMRPKSSVFVFTDAASLNATDLDLNEISAADESFVTRGAIYWGLKVFFFVTDSVDYPIASTADNSYQIYYRIAQNSLGDVVHVGAKKTLGDVLLAFGGYQFDAETIAVSRNYKCSSPRVENLVIDKETSGYFVYTIGSLSLSYDSKTATPLHNVANVNIYAVNASITALSFSSASDDLCSYKIFVESQQSVVFAWTATNSSVDYSGALNVAEFSHSGVARPLNVNGEVYGLSFAALSVSDNSVIAYSTSVAKDRSKVAGTQCTMSWVFGEWASCPPGPFYVRLDVRYYGGRKIRRILPGFCQIPKSRPIVRVPPKCQNGGHWDPKQNCICQPHFSGKLCEVVECVNGGTLNPFPGGPTDLPLCNCPTGYQGQHCEKLSCTTTSQETFDTSRRTLGLAFQTTHSAALAATHVAGAFQKLTSFYEASFADVYFDTFIFTAFADADVSSVAFGNASDFVAAIEGAKFRMSTSATQNVSLALAALLQTNVSSAFEGVRPRSPVFLVVDSPIGDSDDQIDATKALLIENSILLNIVVAPQFFDTCAVAPADMVLYNLIAQSTGGVVLDLCDPSTAKKDLIDLFINDYGQTFHFREVVAETKTWNTTFLEKIVVNSVQDVFYITGWSDRATNFTAVLSKGKMPLALETRAFLPQMTIFRASNLQPGIYNLKFSSTNNLPYSLNVAQPSQFHAWLGFSPDPSHDSSTSFSYYGKTMHPVVHLSSALQGNVTVTATATALDTDYSYSAVGAVRAPSCVFEYFFEKNFACPVNNGYFYFQAEVESSDGVILQRSLPGFCYGVSAEECLNGGHWNGFQCSCPQKEGEPPRYSGTHCEFPICQNGGKLENMACTCPSLVTGKFCEFVQCREWDFFSRLGKKSSTFSSVAFVVQNQLESILVNSYLKQAVPDFVASIDGPGVEQQLSLVTFDEHSVSSVVSTPIVEKFIGAFDASVGAISTASQPGKKGRLIEAIKNAFELTMYRPAVFYVFTSTDTVLYNGFATLMQELANTGDIEINIVYSPMGGPKPGASFDYLSLIPSATNGRFLIVDNNNVRELLDAPLKSMVFENGVVFDSLWEDCSSAPVQAYFPIETRAFWFTVTIRGPNNVDNLTIFDGLGQQLPLGKSNIVFRDSNTVVLQFYKNKMENYVGFWRLSTRSSCPAGVPRCGCQVQTRVSGSLEARVGFSVEQHDDFVERTPFSVGATRRDVFLTAQITNTLLAKEEATLEEVRVFSRKIDLTNQNLLLGAPFITRDVATCSNQFVTSEIKYPQVTAVMSLTVFKLSGRDENGQAFDRYQTFYNNKRQCGQFGHVDEYGRCQCDASHHGFDCRTPICQNGGTADLSTCFCRSGFHGDLCQYRVMQPSSSTTPTATHVDDSNSFDGFSEHDIISCPNHSAVEEFRILHYAFFFNGLLHHFFCLPLPVYYGHSDLFGLLFYRSTPPTTVTVTHYPSSSPSSAKATATFSSSPTTATSIAPLSSSTQPSTIPSTNHHTLFLPNFVHVSGVPLSIPLIRVFFFHASSLNGQRHIFFLFSELSRSIFIHPLDRIHRCLLCFNLLDSFHFCYSKHSPLEYFLFGVDFFSIPLFNIFPLHDEL